MWRKRREIKSCRTDVLEDVRVCSRVQNGVMARTEETHNEAGQSLGFRRTVGTSLVKWRELLGDRTVRQQSLLHPALPVRGPLEDSPRRRHPRTPLAARRLPRCSADSAATQGRTGGAFVRGIAGGHISSSCDIIVAGVVGRSRLQWLCWKNLVTSSRWWRRWWLDDCAVHLARNQISLSMLPELSGQAASGQAVHQALSRERLRPYWRFSRLLQVGNHNRFASSTDKATRKEQ